MLWLFDGYRGGIRAGRRRKQPADKRETNVIQKETKAIQKTNVTQKEAHVIQKETKVIQKTNVTQKEAHVIQKETKVIQILP